MSMEIQNLVERALAASTADGCIVVGSENTQTNLRWAANSLTTNGQMSSRSITIVSTFDGPDGTSAGVVTRAVSTEDELDELVRASEQAGRDAGPAEDAAPLVENYEHGDDWSADPARTDVEVFNTFAPALGAEFERWRKADRLLFGYAEHEVTSTFVATSTGLRRRFDQPDGMVQLNGKSSDYGRSAYASMHTNDFADVDAAALAADVEQRLDWAANRIDLPAGRYETIMPPSTVADLMIYAYWTASARDAEEGRSVFAGPSGGVAAGGGGSRIGDELSALPLRLYSDPAYPGLECAPFEIATESGGGLQSVFDNGLPTAATDWIRDGRLTDLIRTRAWAARSGAEPRPGIGNLILAGAGGGPSQQEMIANTERGLLLTCLWYIREVDPQTLLLTGLTRDGVYLIENGEVTGAVNNFRFNESPIGLLGRATEVGRTELTLSREWGDYFTRTAMPTLRIPDFNMSTVSQAS
ncbi:MAG TPA: metallopeptidase TldD-related protein [Jatrophihabitantaceae bacterium]|nr:metallopeptidase TldD-related protein [Jatrophihabitantaceae bacterium]